jgi:predicted lipoprotein with Yx(FWY)xxD motif
MTLKTILAVVCALALVLTGCAAPSTEVSTATTEPTTVATEPSMSETSVATTEPSATDTGTAETPTVSVPVTGEATVNVSESTTYGPILVDDQGMSLYAFMNDTQNSGTSTCTDEECMTEWPPLLVTDSEPVAGEGVDQALLGTITRDDGTTQVTYNGWPLYYFDEDTTAGDTNGQGMEGVWFLVTPLGETVPQ